jgi:hypothetical protein
VKGKKAEKSNIGTKRIVYVAAAIIIVLVPLIFFLQFYLAGQPSPKAAIIDQLGSSELGAAIRDENQTFLEETRQLLSQRFSIIDFYSDNATVEQYKQLASAGYKLIVWRAHSALDLNSTYIAISTTDKYGSINYDQYLENGQLTLCNITGDQTLYFGITPKFIDEAMSGRFQDTVVILMSCNGLKQGYLKTAQAFEAKGAKVFIGWDGWVGTTDNDNGISLLLQYLINQNDTINAAVGKILPIYSTEFGPAQLQYYPQSAEIANYHIPDYRKQNAPQQSALSTSTSFRKTKEPMGN